jgi:putative tricarboxylic transport membrane protein
VDAVAVRRPGLPDGQVRFPLAPVILGTILGDEIEKNLVPALMTDSNPWLFLTRPISGTMLGLSVAALGQHHRMYTRGWAVAETPDTDF